MGDNIEATEPEDKVRAQVSKWLAEGDHRRAMRWILEVSYSTGIPLVGHEQRADLICLQAEVLRLYRVEERYRKLLKKRRRAKAGK